MKKGLPYLLAIAVLAALVWLKTTVFKKEEVPAGLPGPGGKRPPVPVTVQVVRGESLGRSLFATGTVLPNESADLRPEVSGKIVRLLIVEGAEVKAGQLLAKLNDAELQAQLQKARIGERYAVEAEARQKRLLAAQAVSQEAYDIALEKLETVRADIALLEAQIAKTEIRAPFDGVLGLKKVSEGSMVTPNDVLVTVLQTHQVKIEFSVPEKYASDLRRGDLVRFATEGGTEFPACPIALIAPDIDEASRSLTVRALCPNPKGLLKPGAFVRVTLGLRETGGNLMVPTESVVPVLKGKQVFVVRNGAAQALDIGTGLREAARVQVLEGLREGDSVVVTGVMNLRPGAPVKILN
jgi:membrane fusion protein (multidrug efflux system)